VEITSIIPPILPSRVTKYQLLNYLSDCPKIGYKIYVEKVVEQ